MTLERQSETRDEPVSLAAGSRSLFSHRWTEGAFYVSCFSVGSELIATSLHAPLCRGCVSFCVHILMPGVMQGTCLACMHFLMCWNWGSTCASAARPCLPSHLQQILGRADLCVLDIYVSISILMWTFVLWNVCVCVRLSVFVSRLVFHKPSIFMIQLLHKPQIWFSVFLAEQLRGRGGGGGKKKKKKKKKGETQADWGKQKEVKTGLRESRQMKIEQFSWFCVEVWFGSAVALMWFS